MLRALEFPEKEMSSPLHIPVSPSLAQDTGLLILAADFSGSRACGSCSADLGFPARFGRRQACSPSQVPARPLGQSPAAALAGRLLGPGRVFAVAPGLDQAEQPL